MEFATIIIVLALIGLFLYARYKKQQSVLSIVNEARVEQQQKLEAQLSDSTKKVEDAKKDYNNSLNDYNAKYHPNKPSDSGNGH